MILVGNPIVLLEGETGMTAILTAAGSLLTQLITWAGSITSFLISDSMAVMFLAIMFVMLAVHFVKSFIKTA